MKSIIKVIALMVLAISLNAGAAYAQGGNLQFNQVINHNLTGTTYINTDNGVVNPSFQSITITIPTGKVWKIESASVNLKPEPALVGDIFYYREFDQTVLTINAIDLVKETAGEIGNSGYSFPISPIVSPINIKYPFWMASGTYTLKLTGSYSGIYPNYLTYRASGFLSAIEYNVVP